MKPNPENAQIGYRFPLARLFTLNSIHIHCQSIVWVSGNTGEFKNYLHISLPVSSKTKQNSPQPSRHNKVWQLQEMRTSKTLLDEMVRQGKFSEAGEWQVWDTISSPTAIFLDIFSSYFAQSREKT